jgi:hypothetical protein
MWCKWKTSKSPTQKIRHLSNENVFNVTGIEAQIAVAGFVTGNFLEKLNTLILCYTSTIYYKIAARR